MAFSQAGEPLFTLRQTVTPAEYAEAALLVERRLSWTGLPTVRAVICVLCAALCLSAAPLSLREYGTMWLPLLFAVCFLLLGLWLLLRQPVRRFRELERRFAGSPVLCEETKIDCCRDCVVLQTSCEEILIYWTEFSACVEGGSFAALSGGAWRQLLVLKRDSLPEEQREAFSVFLRDTFGLSSYYPEKRGRSRGRTDRSGANPRFRQAARDGALPRHARGLRRFPRRRRHGGREPLGVPADPRVRGGAARELLCVPLHV